jgi:hypothetical protein
MSWLMSATWSAACTTSTMPTKRESRAPIQSVSVPTRIIWTTIRCRSRARGAAATAPAA